MAASNLLHKQRKQTSNKAPATRYLRCKKLPGLMPQFDEPHLISKPQDSHSTSRLAPNEELEALQMLANTMWQTTGPMRSFARHREVVRKGFIYHLHESHHRSFLGVYLQCQVNDLNHASQL